MPTEAKPAKSTDKPGQGVPPREGARETVESIVFAFILAFLFRTFEAEAFVIPTGSMAPTLYGRHKESDCEKCGSHIVVGASEEVFEDSSLLIPGMRVTRAVCPNCRYVNANIRDALAFNGDRILVDKYPYEFGDPDRWDVFVFKFPEEPEKNYIKRLVGLPGETIFIRNGDIYGLDQEQERILRKHDPSKQRVLQIPVYDNDFPAEDLLKAGWPSRWEGVAREGGAGAVAGWAPTASGWQGIDGSHGFAVDAAGDTLHWLRYRHFVPDPDDWNRLEEGRPLEPRAELVSDFCGYNSFVGGNGLGDLGAYWVGDLTLNADVTVEEVREGGEILLELCEGIHWYRCRITPANGRAVLMKVHQADGMEEEMASAETELQGTGAWSISFANVDDRLCLWIDDDLVDFGDAAAYDRKITEDALPRNSDLSPVGIAARGLRGTVDHLRLERDIYYRSDGSGNVEDGDNHSRQHFGFDGVNHALSQLLAEPERWADEYRKQFGGDNPLQFKIPEGHYLALGDNSPRSNDSRLWLPSLQTVPRNNLVGKAFWTYWPHGVPFLNDGKGYTVMRHQQLVDGQKRSVEDYPRFTIPFYPQFDRMTRIR